MTVVENMFFPIAPALVTEMAPEVELGIHVGHRVAFCPLVRRFLPCWAGLPDKSRATHVCLGY